MAVINQISLILLGIVLLNYAIIQCQSKLKGPRAAKETVGLPFSRGGEDQASNKDIIREVALLVGDLSDHSAPKIDYDDGDDGRENDDPSDENESGITTAKPEDSDSVAKRDRNYPSSKRQRDGLFVKRDENTAEDETPQEDEAETKKEDEAETKKEDEAETKKTNEANTAPGKTKNDPAGGGNKEEFQCTDADVDKESTDPFSKYHAYCSDMFVEDCQCLSGDIVQTLDECVISEIFDDMIKLQTEIEKKRKEVFEKRGQTVNGESKAVKCKAMGDAIKADPTKKGCIEVQRCVKTLWYKFIAYPQTEANKKKLGQNLPKVLKCIQKNMAQCKGDAASHAQMYLKQFKAMQNFSEGGFECDKKDKLENGRFQYYCKNVIDKDCKCHMPGPKGKVLTMEECKDDFMDIVRFQLEIEKERLRVMKKRGHDMENWITLKSHTLECQKKGKAKGYKERAYEVQTRAKKTKAKGEDEEGDQAARSDRVSASVPVLAAAVLCLMAISGSRAPLVLTAVSVCSWSVMCYMC